MLVDIVWRIDGKNAVSIRDVRQKVALDLGLAATGLDAKAELVTSFAQSIMQGEPAPTFDEQSGAAGPPCMLATSKLAAALRAASGIAIRHLPKPRFVPSSAPTLQVGDLNIRDFHGQNPVKHAVDVIEAYGGPMSESDVKKNVQDGVLDQLPSVLRPPLGHVPVNHFVQSAAVRTDGSWRIIRWITFQAEGTDQGKVRPEIARFTQTWEVVFDLVLRQSQHGKKASAHSLSTSAAYRSDVGSFTAAQGLRLKRQRTTSTRSMRGSITMRGLTGRGRSAPRRSSSCSGSLSKPKRRRGRFSSGRTGSSRKQLPSCRPKVRWPRL